MKIAIGSTNPVKIAAVASAFKKVWPEESFEFISVNVKSGVSKQPMSDSESIKGAKNRAKSSLKSSKADFGVGLEGGVNKVGKYWFDCGWIFVVHKSGMEGIGSSIRMHTPSKMMKMIKKGLELGEVDDILFNTKNSKQKYGHFGHMTKNKITRTKGYEHAVISALARFLNPDIF